MPRPFPHQFAIDGHGRLHEMSVRETVESLQAAVAGADDTSLEAEFMLLRTNRLVTSIRDAHWAKFGLSASRVVLMRHLYTAASQSMSMGEIATEMNLGANSVTQLVDALDQRHLVKRVSADRDKRMVVVSLTPEGERLTRELLPENVRRIADAWSPLTKTERQVLSHLLAKVRLHLLTKNSMFDEELHSNGHDEVIDLEANLT